MIIALLAKRASIHTIRWANALATRGHEIHLLGPGSSGEALDDQVCFHPFPTSSPLGYLLNGGWLSRLLGTISPHVLNAHYASSYGTLARLSRFQPTVLSVWGSDVYDFPAKSPLHRKLVRDNLRSPAWVSSTSNAMALQVRRLYEVENLSVVPFGIDVKMFSPLETAVPSEGPITIGTIKSLDRKYGIDTLIDAFALLRQRLTKLRPDTATRLRLLIVGEGPDLHDLENLARRRGVADVTRFAGKIPHSEVAEYLRQIHTYVALSRFDSESFGVAVLEASAVGKPVVVSEAGGLPEVVLADRTGFIVPREDPSAAANAIERLVLDQNLHQSMGKCGRRHVVESYDWEKCVSLMEEVYFKARQVSGR